MKYTRSISRKEIGIVFTVEFQTEKLSHADLDERALDALKEFPVEGALAVLKQFLESNLVVLYDKCVGRIFTVVFCSGACVQQVRLPVRGDENLQAEISRRSNQLKREWDSSTGKYPE